MKISFTDFYQLDNFFLPNISSQQNIFFSKLHQIYAQVRDFLHFFTFQRSEMTISFKKKLESDNCFFCVIIFFFFENAEISKKKKRSCHKKKTVINIVKLKNFPILANFGIKNVISQINVQSEKRYIFQKFCNFATIPVVVL